MFVIFIVSDSAITLAGIFNKKIPRSKLGCVLKVFFGDWVSLIFARTLSPVIVHFNPASKWVMFFLFVKFKRLLSAGMLTYIELRFNK